MKEDPILTKFREFGKNHNDDHLGGILLNVVEVMRILSKEDSREKACSFMREKYLHIGSLSEEAQKLRKESILESAWPIENDGFGFGLKLSNDQYKALLDCFKNAKYLCSLRNTNPDKNDEVQHFFESELLRFKINLHDSSDLSLICWFYKTDETSLDEEVDLLIKKSMEYRTTYKRTYEL